MQQGELVTVQAASQATGIPARTIRRWILDGRLSAELVAGARRVSLEAVLHVAGELGRGQAAGAPPAAAAMVPGQWPDRLGQVLELLDRRYQAEILAKDALIAELRRRAEAAEAQLLLGTSASSSPKEAAWKRWLPWRPRRSGPPS